MKKLQLFVVIFVAAFAFAGCTGGGLPTCPANLANKDAMETEATDITETDVSETEGILVAEGLVDSNRDAETWDSSGDVVIPWDTGREIAPGVFGASCESNTDCESGFCVETPWGYVCTQSCVSDCPAGWLCKTFLMGGDMIGLCTPTGISLCKPCTKDEQCSEGKCITVGAGKFCGMDCQESGCPPNYACKSAKRADPSATGEMIDQCVPISGACDCGVANKGAQRVCEVSNALGRCLGTETCDPKKGWVGCDAKTPSVEECDGEDDDCNGIVDDRPKLPDTACENTVKGVGTCIGTWVCKGAVGWDCVARTPKPETCNYVDDNCNGLTDETFKTADGTKYNDVENCGECGNSCLGKIAFAASVLCDASGDTPVCKVDKCQEGYLKQNDYTCKPMVSSLCVPCQIDENCGLQGNKCLDMGTGVKYCGRDCSEGSSFGTDCPQGYACKAFEGGPKQCAPISGTCDCGPVNEGLTKTCARKNAAGTCYGQQICNGDAGWGDCDAKEPKAESCNGIDDNCNGLVDEDMKTPEKPCENSWTNPDTGEKDTCKGRWLCTEHDNKVQWWCNAKMPMAEQCNHLDDDCDGKTDEDFKLPGTNKYVGLNNCGMCGYSCVGLIPHATAKCDGTKPNPTCVVDTCDKGYYKVSELTCLEAKNYLCSSCSSDDDCPVPGDKCLDLPDGKFCGRDCSANNVYGTPEGVCQAGYTCVDEAVGKQCEPVSRACDCMPGDEGKTKVCWKANDNGKCLGSRICDPKTGWSACDAKVPSVETCNGKDDNCNGLADETFTDLGAVCSVGVGKCKAIGSMVCKPDGTGTECSARAGTPTKEICDGKDDNCNGVIDDTWKDSLGKPCTVGKGECTAIGVNVCKADGSGYECNARAGTPTKEICDGKDDNCNGQVDENWANLAKPCTVGKGECTAIGVNVCKADGSGYECNATPGTPHTEICDGKDDNCNGVIDDTWKDSLGKPCTVGKGECTAIGVNVCKADGSGYECNARAGTPTKEICDGKDNNCNGVIDDTWKDSLGKPCTVGKGECTAIGVNVCKPDGSGYECNARAGKPTAEICDGKDNNCNGQVDDGFNVGQPCTSGVGECQRAGVYLCNGAHATKCNATPGTSHTEICDGLDNNCNGRTDENWPELGTVCYAGIGACKAAGKYVCKTNHTGTTCDATAGKAHTETCNYIDDNCNGSTDETFKDNGVYDKDTACGNCFTDCTTVWSPAINHANSHCVVSSGSPTCTFTCVSGYADADGNPENGCEMHIDAHAIYVSTPNNGGADNSTCGAWGSPCASIFYGESRAHTLGRTRVLVSSGLYAEQVTMINGVSVMGGYNAATWARNPESNITIIQGVSPTSQRHKKAVIAVNITSSTEFSGFTVYGENNFYQAINAAGGNSYAIYVRNSTGALVIKENVIYAGRGSKGSDGTKGIDGHNGGNGGNGQDGGDHNHTCGNYHRIGGTGGSSACSVRGGNGASSRCPNNNTREPSGANGIGTGHGNGGVGGYDSYIKSSNCYLAQVGAYQAGYDGTDGASGFNGNGGTGCSSASGHVSGNDWVPYTATNGSNGHTGASGGGGGAGAGVEVDSGCNNKDTLGGAGGAGGAGGCLGTSGRGGYGGGASIAVFVIWTNSGYPSSLPQITKNLLIRNQAGNGGTGGNAGIGGTGGKGGTGGNAGGTYKWAAGKGGHGGNGGNGGPGGGGGGGCGAASYGVYTSGLGSSASSYCSGNTYDHLGDGGAGGTGGSSNGHAGSAGSSGTASSCSNH